MCVKIKEVYAVSDREYEEETKPSLIGVALVNEDSSLNVILDAIPLTGKLFIKDREIINSNRRRMS